MTWEDKVQALLPEAKQNEYLKTLTSLAVGGIADYVFIARTIDELIKAVSVARQIGAPYRVIGYGSNILPSDSGFEGLIIVNRTNGLQIDENSGRIIVDSGVSLSRLIIESASMGLGGLESLFGIPGTVGGAIIVNAGAHGASVSQYLDSSTVLISSEKMMTCKADWFGFGYRQSKLKYSKSDSPPVILNAIFQFQHRKKEDALQDIAKYKKWREDHQPLGIKTSGSVFRNPAGTDATEKGDERLKSAGYLLDTAGAKDLAVGDARVCKKHANWIENRGRASACDIRNLIEQMRKLVEEKYSVTLLEEVEYLGDWSSCELTKDK